MQQLVIREQQDMDGSAGRDDQLAELRSLLASAVEHAERGYRHIERELHSGPEQRLVAAALDLRLNGLTGGAVEVDRIVSELTAIAAELRSIGREAFPAVLAETGLGPGLRALSRRAELPIAIEMTDDRRHPLPVELAIYRSVAAAIPVFSRRGAGRLSVTVTGDEEVTQTTIRPDGDDRLDRVIDDELLDLATRARVIAAGGTIRIERTASDAPEVVIRFPAPLRL